MGNEHFTTSQEDNATLKQRLEDQNEEMANSKKVLKEEIFKRWRAEEALRESEEKNKRLLESFEDGYFEVDLSGNLTFFNESLCRMVGYSPQEMMGMNNRQYMSPATSKKVFDTFNEVFRTGKATKAFGWELVRKDGQVRQVETSVSPVFGPEGDKIGFRGIARDVTERWLAERACRKSEEKYREIIESIEDGYYEVDLKGNLVFFNNALKRILGYSSEEMMGMNNRKYMSEQTAKTVYATFNEVYRSGKPTKAFDWELSTKNREKRYLETSVAPVRDSSGQMTGFSGIARDVTERRLARKTLEESEQKYRTILETIEDGYYEVDLEGSMTFFNEALCRITGYSPEELLGMNNRKYTEPEMAKKMFAIFNRVYRTGEPSKIDDYEVIKKNGTKAVLELSTAIIRNPAGEAIGFRGIARDITEQQRMKQALKQSEEKYRTILESIEDGYYEVDIRGNFVFFNESMCNILGYSEHELKGMNNRHFMSEETSKRVFQTFNQVYQTGKPAKALGWELIRKDGERRYIETSISLMQTSEGEPAGFRGIARDITGIKRLEKAKERAINHLSHELGTPLSIIEGVVKRIPDELTKGNVERIHEWVERVKRNLMRLRELQSKIDDILNERPALEKERIIHLVDAAIAFLDEVKDEPLKESTEALRQNIVRRLDSLQRVEESRKETIALDAFVHQLCQDTRLSMKDRQVEIVERVEKGVCVEMDPKVLKKVCDGFLKNAIENTPDEGRIEIELRN
ncbi:MAG: PAS domain S-box protein, partial [Desulfobacterota bacterium]|nr:PAS domain S-box protein [Thermodesulfobacteriota bacterium]